MSRLARVTPAAAALAATLALAPAALASPASPNNLPQMPGPSPAVVSIHPELSPDNHMHHAAPTGKQTFSEPLPQPLVVRSTSNGGFDWADAAVGAAAALGLTLAATGAAAGLRGRKRALPA